MAEFKVVLSNPKSGKSYQKELKDSAAEFLLGKKIGDKISGEAMDLTGYEFEITGGSDRSGFPMRRDIPGATRSKILAVSGIGIRKTREGMRRRKTVFGNTVDNSVAQINMKILKEGKEKLGPDESPEQGKEEVKKEKKPAAKTDKKEA